MKVLILTGGNSSERKISFLSARNVKKTLEENGHKVKLYDLSGGYKPIIKISKNYDILFPVLHGEEGEGGKLHEFLSKIGKPIVGTRNYKGMKAAWYKIPFKKYCDKNNIQTSPWKIIKSKKDIINFGLPCVLKASNGGSSREVAILKTKKDINSVQVDRILLSKQAYVEKYLPGTEITCGILSGKALPLIEIIPTEDSWFSYKTKYVSSTKELINAPSINKRLQEKAKKIALKIHKFFNLGTYSRTDFIVSGNFVYVLEINTIPGLTSESLLPKQAKAIGMDFGQFLEILLSSAK